MKIRLTITGQSGALSLIKIKNIDDNYLSLGTSNIVSVTGYSQNTTTDNYRWFGSSTGGNRPYAMPNGSAEIILNINETSIKSIEIFPFVTFYLSATNVKIEKSEDDTTYSVVGELNFSEYVLSKTLLLFKNKTFILHDGEYKKCNPYKPASLGRFPENRLTGSSYSNYEFTASSSIDGTINGGSVNSTFSNKAFDGGDKGTVVDSWIAYMNPPNGKTHWLKAEFKTPKIFKGIEIFFSHYSGTEPALRKFSLYASNDNVTYTKLYDGNFTGVSYETVAYMFDNSTAYKYYMLSDLSNDYGTSIVGLGELTFLVPLGKSEQANWSTVSSTLPTSQQFLSDGMDSLSPLLDRKVQTLESLPMLNKTSVLMESGEIGKVFSKTVDLKKYMDIRKIEVK